MSTQQSASYPLAQNITRLRKERNLSQEQLADQLGVTRQAVSKWESGEGFPEVERLIELSNYFQVTLDALIKGDGQLDSSTARSNDGSKEAYHPAMNAVPQTAIRWVFITICVIFISISAVAIAVVVSPISS